MKKILILMLLSLSWLNPIRCMEKEPEIETSGFESLPLEIRRFVFTLLIEGHFHNCNDVFELYKKISDLRKTLARITLVSKSFFPFSKEELEECVNQLKVNSLDHFKSRINNWYAGLSQEDLDAKLYYSLDNDNNLKKAAELILAGANINLQTNFGWTALMWAALLGHTEIVLLLLDHKANLDLQHFHGYTALIWAVLKGHTEIAQLLLYHNANPNLLMNLKWTALILAARNGHTETVKLLLDYGANINHQDQEGQTALMIATKKGHKEIVQLLQNKAGQNKNKRCTIQ